MVYRESKSGEAEISNAMPLSLHVLIKASQKPATSDEIWSQHDVFISGLVTDSKRDAIAYNPYFHNNGERQSHSLGYAPRSNDLCFVKHPFLYQLSRNIDAQRQVPINISSRFRSHQQAVKRNSAIMAVKSES
ncbi:hypothetical protein CHS0354_017329, partial [Potamilus streckersoni]